MTLSYVRPDSRGPAAEISNHRHRRLLSAHRQRPCHRRAAEQRDEFAPLHSMTSSASARSLSGTSRPSVLAVLMLSTNSNLVDCITGKSPAFSPPENATGIDTDLTVSIGYARPIA